MSLPRQSSLQRGASVLAALVIAAALASISLLVQQGNPVVSSKMESQTAEAANANSPEAVFGPGQTTDQQTDCLPGYNYRVAQAPKGQQPVTQCVHVMDCGSTAPQTSTLNSNKTATARSCQTSSGTAAVRDDAKCKAWKCQTQYCYYASTNPILVKCMDVAGGVSPGEKVSSSNVKQAAVEDMVGAITAGEGLSPDMTAALKQDPAMQKAFDDAYESNSNDLQKQIKDESAKAVDYMSQLKVIGCDTSGMIGQQQCVDLNQKLSQTREEVDDLNNQYAALQDAKFELGKSNPGGYATAEQVDICLDGGGDCQKVLESYCSGAGSAIDDTRCGDTLPHGNPVPKNCSGANCVKDMPTGFNPNSGPQKGNDKSGAGGLGNLAKGLGGGSGSGGGSGAGQQQPQQQQCQPQYQCTTSGTASTVMYNQCPQQNSQWQTYQQCPTGYTCQNNGCVATAPYGYCTSGQPRTAPAQAQPAASSCTVGTWTDASNGCQTNWQCTAGAAGSTTAQLSCQPLVAASGTVITFSYVCANGATAATASNFTIPTATTLSGTATTSAQKPADGTSSVTYGLTCTNANVSPSLTASAQCAVQVGNAAIVLVATPEKIAKTETEDLKRKSTVGWVTSGMQSCVISNADFIDWTSQQAGNTSVSGAAVSPIITADTIFKLTCQTLGGTTASSTVKVLSI